VAIASSSLPAEPPGPLPGGTLALQQRPRNRFFAYCRHPQQTLIAQVPRHELVIFAMLSHLQEESD
jgi:hypothetical protein